MNEREIKTTAIVTRANNYKENDKILTLFSKENGKMNVASRGCRRQKSNLMSASSVFVYGEFLLYNKDDRYSLISAEIRHNFYNITKAVESFGVANLIINICEQMANPGEAHNALFALLIYVLDMLEKEKKLPLDVLFCFIIKSLDIYGIRPKLDECETCGNTDAEYFSIREGALVCKDCRDKFDSVKISKENLKDMKNVLSTKNSNISDLEIFPDRNIINIMLKFLEYNGDIELYARDFLHKIDML